MKLNCIFTDNMVFQACRPIRIFGEGRGCCSVSFAGKTKKLVSDSDKWMVEFEEMEYGGPYNMEIVLNGEKTELKNIIVGEVILCSGQSNIAFTMSENEDEITHEADSNIRTFVTTRPVEYTGLKTENGWVEAKRENIPYWSAIGYFVAKKIASANIPVGIIGCYQGASVIQSWLPEESASKNEFFIPKEELKGNHINDFSAWNPPSFLYNYTINNILPFSIGNVIWYQGESNTASSVDSEMYEKLLKELITIWRGKFMYPNLPFVVVQIHDFDERDNEWWKTVQKSQENICNLLEHTKLVESKLYCTATSIHPPKKKALSEHIAKVILHNFILNKNKGEKTQ